MINEKTQLNFIRRSSPVLVEHRPLYKIGLLVLILYVSSRGGKSSLLRLHLFNWALKQKERQQLLYAASEIKDLKVSAWGFDPAFAIAIRYAVAEGLISEIPSGYKITNIGISLVKDILTNNDLLAKEKLFLMKVGKNITEAMVTAVANSWEA
ncbi:hypothetical protein [Pectobacterium carotovorum]|uniref:hypothetical protein n=1 Tax=Pectobacterium carotovorum TaxID=554 RepID=UPI0037F910CD